MTGQSNFSQMRKSNRREIVIQGTRMEWLEKWWTERFGLFVTANADSPPIPAPSPRPIRESYGKMFEVASENGYFLCNKYSIPEEVLALILSHVPPKELVFNCRNVCKYWCNIIDFLVWRIKLERLNVPPNKVIGLPWHACFWIVMKAPIGRNLVKNDCGQEGLKFWNILSSGGSGWKVEKPPVGCQGFSEDEELSKNVGNILKNNSCFATSYYSCTKKQLIDLKKEGIHPEVMDLLQPQITITDWCCGRFDCSSIYDIKVTLLNKEKKSLIDFKVRKRLGSRDGSEWQKVTHTFLNYGPGVKFVEFYHGGMDSQFWKGHYGSKMTGASVIVTFQ